MLYSERSKSRGQKRCFDALCRRIDEFVPFTDTDRKYEHFHVPSDSFINHPRTSSKIKTAFCRKWLETTQKYISEKPANLDLCRVVAAICPENLWDSQIIIFYDREYYEWFFSRDGDADEMWTAIQDSSRSFVKEQGVGTPLPERGYVHGYTDEESHSEDEIWFYGEIPDN